MNYPDCLRHCRHVDGHVYELIDGEIISRKPTAEELQNWREESYKLTAELARPLARVLQLQGAPHGKIHIGWDKITLENDGVEVFSMPVEMVR